MSRTASRRQVESTGSRVLEQSRVRLLCVGVVFFLCFLSINMRLVEMMVSPRYSLPKLFPQHYPVASREPEDSEASAGPAHVVRANIVDRNGALLATSLMTQSAYANPREIDNPFEAAARLSVAVGVPRDELLSRLTGKKSFAWIKRRLTPLEQQAVNTLGIPGVYFTPEEERVYPYGNLFSHTVGYVNVDNKGLSGAEAYFNKRLTDEAKAGEPLQLSLDARVQYILRSEVAHAAEEFHAQGATGVVLDARTSEVLAMTSLPDFDPNHEAHATDTQRFDRATQGLYEMGSTFKSFTVAQALDRGVVTYKDGFDATHPLVYAGFTINDDHPRRRWLSVPEIYAYSSNIGAAKMALQIGPKRQRAFMEQLGMLSPLEIELPERAQPLYPKEWQGISVVTISYGHGIAVTPLHMARGIAALVNGGEMRPLTLLKGGNRDTAEERLISADTSRLVARLMRLVVERGTGKKADVPGYRVGGKTGTAEKAQAGGYSKSSNIVSFVSAFPVDDPRYVVLVMVDDPKPPTHAMVGDMSGGWVAAPAVGRVIARAAPLLGVTPDFNPKHDDAEKYWVSTEKKAPVRTPKPAQVAMPQAPIIRQYVRNAAY